MRITRPAAVLTGTAASLAGVFAAPKAGWKVVVSSVKLTTPIVTDDGTIDTAVSTIIWTATGRGTGPGQYDDFDIAVGQLPKTESVTFKVLQSYSDGTVVRWIELNAPGSTQEPEHPAPQLSLTHLSIPAQAPHRRRGVALLLALVALVRRRSSLTRR